MHHTARLTCPQEYRFTLKNDEFVQPDRARERYVGITNRVISGMLMHQVRLRGGCVSSAPCCVCERCVGLTNLVVSGMLMRQVRLRRGRVSSPCCVCERCVGMTNRAVSGLQVHHARVSASVSAMKTDV